MSDYMRLTDEDCADLLFDILARQNQCSDALRWGLRSKGGQNPYSAQNYVGC